MSEPFHKTFVVSATLSLDHPLTLLLRLHLVLSHTDPSVSGRLPHVPGPSPQDSLTATHWTPTPWYHWSPEYGEVSS